MISAFVIPSFGILYRLLRPILFLTDSESIHIHLTRFGEFLGRSWLLRSFIGWGFRTRDSRLEQTIHGIPFPNPIGLAAGFDYEARLPGILPALGFGFGTVGTITNHSYEGNPGPRLGRLVKSKSLLVNKGFKNLGIQATLGRLQSSSFAIPAGLSIGKTNSQDPMTQSEAVDDILSAFRAAEVSSIPFAYYELNISCPNLWGTVEFYSSAHLDELLNRLDSLTLRKPLFIKMPIDKTDNETLAMLRVIALHRVQGVIFGNLQKNRRDPALNPQEVAGCGRGNFSGMPTQQRSDELIALAYRNFGERMTIIGCGGVFKARDAYRKIRLGASLVQLVTGLVYEGPQLAGQINRGLLWLLDKDGFTSVTEAIGVDAR